MSKIFIRDLNTHFCLEAKKAGFENVENVDITTVKASCVVSPANSFGFMDGGVDAAYMKRFPGIQDHVQKIIKNQGGELLIGQAVATFTDDGDIPFLIAAPTMRVPSIIPDPMDVYLATRAAMREWLFITTQIEGVGENGISFPSMGTSCGGVSFDVAADVAARAMKIAIEDAFKQPEYPGSTDDMVMKHLKLKYRILNSIG